MRFVGRNKESTCAESSHDLSLRAALRSLSFVWLTCRGIMFSKFNINIEYNSASFIDLWWIQKVLANILVYD